MTSGLAAFEQGFRHHQAGRLAQAEQFYHETLKSDPGHSPAWHLLGVVALQSGRHDDAVEYIRRAIVLDGQTAAYHCDLSIALGNLGQATTALEAGRRAVVLQPESARAHTALGDSLHRLKEFDEAASAYYRAWQLQPRNHKAARRLGATLMQLPSRLAEAISVLRQALEVKPDYVEATNDLGCALKYAGRFEEAADAFDRVVSLRPSHAGAYNNLSTTLRTLGRLGDAVAACRKSISLQPDLTEAHLNLGIALADLGQLADAEAAFDRALELEPSFAPAQSRRLFGMHYRWGITPGELATAHASFDERHAAKLPRNLTPHDNDLDPERRLRIGFVSEGFGLHPVGYFLAKLLETADIRHFEFVCYSDRTRKDAMTRRFQNAAIWNDVFQVTNEELADRIRADRIDILFDVDGHAGRDRLLTFARKPAPVQISWLGYVGTTGLAAMDYLLADRWHVPPCEEPNYRERILRLPGDYICYEPPGYAPEVPDLPALSNGFVTFGSFNQLAKVNHHVVQIWANVLKRVAGSRLLLKYRGFDDEAARDHFLELFAHEGVAPDRIELQGKSPHPELLATYNRVDIALDTRPYSGGLTTCEALWMGVPVVTWPGETFASRHSLSHLSNVGLLGTVSHSETEYIDCAVRLAGDLARLAGIRQSLRQQMARSTLCDADRFARNWSRLIRQVWRHYCARPRDSYE